MAQLDGKVTPTPLTVLVVGATGIGRLAVEEAIRHGHRTRALVRDPTAPVCCCASRSAPANALP
jgi:NAD(P)-dependent dehydrogenase (short-subunit alcohol dehydrogenase family)